MAADSIAEIYEHAGHDIGWYIYYGSPKPEWHLECNDCAMVLIDPESASEDKS